MRQGRLQNILLFRELKFPLKEIAQILDRPDFDWRETLSQQIALLTLEHKRLGELIRFAREIQEKGVTKMEFDAFDRSEIETYKEEIAKRWGIPKNMRNSPKKKRRGLMERKMQKSLWCFLRSLEAKNLPPSVQEKIGALQQFITEHYYTCSKEILFGLGQMYTQDERFRHNIDLARGEGCAKFAVEAIAVYCVGK